MHEHSQSDEAHIFWQNIRFSTKKYDQSFNLFQFHGVTTANMMAFIQDTYDDDDNPFLFTFYGRTVCFSAFPQGGTDDNTLMLTATEAKEQVWKYE